MRVLSFLVLSFLLSTFCSAYVVVLNSGKRVEGTLLGEDSTTLQIKDSAGIVLSFKKTMIDGSATVQANTRAIPKPKLNGAEVNVKPSRPVYKNEDVSRMPELSVIEGNSEFSQSEPDEPQELLTRSDPNPKEERSWRNRAESLKRELARLRERRITAEASCEQSRQNATSRLASPQKKPINMLSIFEKSSACKLMEEIDHQLEAAEERWNDFETEARRAEVPWQWID